PLSAVEKVKEESHGLRGDLAPQLAAGGDHFSDASAQLLKFHGTYQQEDRDQRRALRGTDGEPAHQFMVRCKIPGGVLTGEQYLVIDDLADRYGNGTLRVTTRQGNQFHGVLSNDLGFLVVVQGDRLAGFNVLVGGGMGRTHGKTDTYPRLADTLGFARIGEVREVAEAVVKVQRDHGNRSDRRHARLKYLLDKQGLDWFREQVERQLGRPLAPAASVQVSDIEDHLGWHEQGRGRSFLGVFVENGRIRDGEDRRLRSALRRVVETVGGGVRFTPQQNLLLTDIPDRQRPLVDRILADHGVAGHRSLSVVRRWSMACPAL